MAVHRTLALQAQWFCSRRQGGQYVSARGKVQRCYSTIQGASGSAKIRVQGTSSARQRSSSARVKVKMLVRYARIRHDEQGPVSGIASAPTQVSVGIVRVTCQSSENLLGISQHHRSCRASLMPWVDRWRLRQVEEVRRVLRWRGDCWGPPHLHWSRRRRRR